MDEDYTFITLRCKYCDKEDTCIYCPVGRIWRGKEGCTRKVSEQTAARFYHYTEEVIPFWKTWHDKSKVDESYNEIYNFLQREIYSAPIGQRLDSEGKVRLRGY